MKNIPLRKALVIGGGFSGMSAAIALRKHGIAVDLVEIDPGWRSYGAGISLGSPTLRAFEELGILDEFLLRGFGSDGLDLCLPHGAHVGQLVTPRLVGADRPAAGAIMRPVLAAIMAEATRGSGTRVRLGCTVVDIRQDDDAADVDFSDGSTGRYDVVIGADGLYSQTRARHFPDAPLPRYSGQGVWRAVVPRPADLVRPVMWLGGDVKPGVNPVSQEEMYLFVTENRPTNEHIPTAAQPGVLRALLAPFSAPLVRQIRDQIDEHAQVIYRPLESMLLPKPWFQGRVVLIGDAVHATTPHLASGACIGIEDGLVLADELVRADTVAEGLSRFQDRRWERCRMVVENSGRLGTIEIEGGDKAEHSRLMTESMMALAQPI